MKDVNFSPLVFLCMNNLSVRLDTELESETMSYYFQVDRESTVFWILEWREYEWEDNINEEEWQVKTVLGVAMRNIYFSKIKY